MKIDPEFHALIPPPSDEERTQLEQNLIDHGCRDALTVWGPDELVLDGHNRYEICERRGIQFEKKAIDLQTRDDAKAWIIRNQFGRRNLQPYQRAELVLQLEPLIWAKAKARQEVTLKKGNEMPVVAIWSTRDKTRTRTQLAKLSGLGEGTIYKAKAIAAKAPESVKADLRKDRRGPFDRTAGNEG